MVDLCKRVFKLSKARRDAFSPKIDRMLIEGEKSIVAFQGVRDGLVFTNKRIFVIDVQGITGSKVSYATLAYEKIQLFAVETSGVLDFDGELAIWYSGIGKIQFEFDSGVDMLEISKIISRYSLQITPEEAQEREIQPESIRTVPAAAIPADSNKYDRSLADFDGVCPACGTKHYNNRNKCVKCGAEFKGG